MRTPRGDERSHAAPMRVLLISAFDLGHPNRRRPGTARFTPVPVPQMSEPWYCCAEPTEEQLVPPI